MNSLTWHLLLCRFRGKRSSNPLSPTHGRVPLPPARILLVDLIGDRGETSTTPRRPREGRWETAWPPPELAAAGSGLWPPLTHGQSSCLQPAWMPSLCSWVALSSARRSRRPHRVHDGSCPRVALPRHKLLRVNLAERQNGLSARLWLATPLPVMVLCFISWVVDFSSLGRTSRTSVSQGLDTTRQTPGNPGRT